MPNTFSLATLYATEKPLLWDQAVQAKTHGQATVVSFLLPSSFEVPGFSHNVHLRSYVCGRQAYPQTLL